MSKFANKPIKIPSNISIKLDDIFLVISNKNKPNLSTHIALNKMKHELKGDDIFISKPDNSKQNTINHGTVYRNVQNAINNLSSDGLSVKMTISGVGFKAEIKNQKYLYFALGFSHPIYVEIPPSITVSTADGGISINGNNIQDISTFVDKVSKLKRIDPYKAKGVYKVGKFILRKETKVGKK